MQPRHYLVMPCQHNPQRLHAVPLDTMMRTASAHGDHAFMQQLEDLENLRYEVDDDSESDISDPYAAGITALQHQQQPTVNPSPLFQMAAEKERQANDDRAAFEARDKAERLAALKKSYGRVKAERMSAFESEPPSHSLTPSALSKYAAPDPYAAGIKALREKQEKK